MSDRYEKLGKVYLTPNLFTEGKENPFSHTGKLTFFTGDSYDLTGWIKKTKNNDNYLSCKVSYNDMKVGYANIFRNLKKDTAKRPDYSGVITLASGDAYFVSLWTQKNKDGLVELLGTVCLDTHKKETAKKNSAEDDENEMPF